jgi:hypothetical protein
MRAYIQRWSIIKNSAEHVYDERAIDAFIAGIRKRDLIEELGRSNPRTVAELMETANRWADGEDTVHNKRQRSPEEDRNRNNNQHRRCFRNFVEYDDPGQVLADFLGNNGGNHRDDYHRRNEQRSDHIDAPSSSRQNNRPMFPRPYNVSPEKLLNGPCQMHFYVDSDGRRKLGHLQKDCRTFQALQRATESTEAEAIRRGYAYGLRSDNPQVYGITIVFEVSKTKIY